MEEFRTLVLYRSQHGTTKKYAQWIGDALNADVMEAGKKDFNNWLELFGWKKRKPFFWQKANNKSKDGEYPQEHQSQTP